MRFNNRACALMDIPDLPQGAFEHIGDRKIKPQGGGGGGGVVDVFSPITDPISSVLGTDGGGGGILGAVEDVGQAIGGGLADVDKFVNQNLPGGWISPALIAGAVAAPYLAPALAAEGAGAAAFTGATETGLATLASEAAVADTVGAALLSGAAETAAAEAVTQALPYTLAADASNLAANGFSEATIAQNLTASGVDSFVAADAANLAAQGLSESAIAQNLAQAYTTAELAGTGITSNALGAASKFALSPSQALQAARLGMGLLGGRPQQQMPQMPQMGGSYGTSKPGGVVDYSGLYNLLALQKPKNPNSLLG
jgi:hypothetical protein